jgi:hypothetical protein
MSPPYEGEKNNFAHPRLTKGRKLRRVLSEHVRQLRAHALEFAPRRCHLSLRRLDGQQLLLACICLSLAKQRVRVELGHRCGGLPNDGRPLPQETL